MDQLAERFNTSVDDMNRCLNHTAALLNIRRDMVLDVITRRVSPPLIQQKLLEMICFQHINLRFGNALLERLLALQRDDNVTMDSLLAAKFSAKKAEAILATIKFFETHQYTPNQMSVDDTVAYLSQIKGVGAWTIKLALIDVEQRPDVLMVEDLEFRKGLAIFLNLSKAPSIKEASKLVQEEFKDRNVWSQVSMLMINLSRARH